jgi:signal transduction histidine kinase
MVIRDIPAYKYLVKHDSNRYLIIAFLIFGLGVIVSVINWQVVEHRTHTSNVDKYHQELNQSRLIVTSALDQYSVLLDDGTGLLTVYGDNVGQAQWLAFFKSQDLVDNYPGIDGVNFAEYITNDQLPNYLNTMVAQGEPSFSITPAGARNVYVPITYLGYVSPVSLQALGLDQFANSTRRVAIMQALDSGMLSMSGRITSVAFRKGQSSFLIYKPIYNGPSATQAERQSSIFGFVYAGINSSTFFNSLLSRYSGPGVAIQIYDGRAAGNSLLYESPEFTTRFKHIADPLSSDVDVRFGGQLWHIRVVISQDLIEAGSNQSALSALLGGVVASLVLAGTLWYFTYYRDRKFFWQKQMEVQAAKNELLSLASHQLRTPATIVKQYLGVLLQNYAGDITEQQRSIIQIAYDSNEHQLKIANQFLDAARLESGRIKLNPKELVLNDLLQEVVDEQRQIARQRRQKIIYKSPKRTYKFRGDPKYLPMVFENLLSNAIKYSKRGSKIGVSLSRSGSTLHVCVSDSGVGIPQEEQAGIFDKFTRTSNKENIGRDGTGIGLYLVKQIIGLHSGDIQVESTLGKGSKFTVILPTEGDQKPPRGKTP